MAKAWSSLVFRFGFTAGNTPAAHGPRLLNRFGFTASDTSAALGQGLVFKFEITACNTRAAPGQGPGFDAGVRLQVPMPKADGCSICGVARCIAGPERIHVLL